MLSRSRLSDANKRHDANVSVNNASTKHTRHEGKDDEIDTPAILGSFPNETNIIIFLMCAERGIICSVLLWAIVSRVSGSCLEVCTRRAAGVSGPDA